MAPLGDVISATPPYPENDLFYLPYVLFYARLGLLKLTLSLLMYALDPPVGEERFTILFGYILLD